MDHASADIGSNMAQSRASSGLGKFVGSPASKSSAAIPFDGSKAPPRVTLPPFFQVPPGPFQIPGWNAPVPFVLAIRVRWRLCPRRAI